MPRSRAEFSSGFEMRKFLTILMIMVLLTLAQQTYAQDAEPGGTPSPDPIGTDTPDEETNDPEFQLPPTPDTAEAVTTDVPLEVQAQNMLTELGVSYPERFRLSYSLENGILTVSLNGSEAFVAPTEAAATQVAQSIDFKPGNNYEHPSNMCGPLSAQILFDGGILTDDMFAGGYDSGDFWLADPSRIYQLFPSQYFTFENHIDTGESITGYDFGDDPLKVGDFLYLIGGNFDHMLVITRIEYDENGEYKAYSSTNVYTADGYAIQDAMVFDSENPYAGLFEDFGRSNSWTGMTGTRGFLRVRANGNS